MSPMTVVASGAWVAIASAPTAAAASGAAYLPAYLLALGLTLAVEVPVYAVLARAFAWVSWPLALVAGVVVNVLTHPLMYAAAQHFDAWWQLATAEAMVALIEAAVLVWAWRRRPTEWWVWVGAVVANALSVLAGFVVLPGLARGA